MGQQTNEVMSAVSAAIKDVDFSKVPDAALAHEAPVVETPAVEEKVETPVVEEKKVDDKKVDEKVVVEDPKDEIEVDQPAVDDKGAPVEGGEKKKRKYMPTERHEAVLKKARGEHETAIADVHKKYAEYESPDFKERIGALKLAESDVNGFLDVLERVPAYKEALGKRYGTAPAAEKKAGEERKKVEMPKPNIVHEDGRVGYDAEAAQQLAQYHAQQETEELRTQLAELRKVIDPVAQERESKSKNEADYRAALERNKVLLENYRANWPGFKDNEPAIKALVTHEDPTKRLPIDQAYHEVVTKPRLASEADVEKRVRDKIAKEKADAIAAGGQSVKPGVVGEVKVKKQDDEDANDGMSAVERAVRAATKGLK
jgi:hypothetical protein